MPSNIEDQIEASGVAQVIVILKSPPPPSPKAEMRGAVALTAAASTTSGLVGLDKYFVQSELSQNFALAVAGHASALTAATTSARARRIKAPPAVMHFPNLGVLLGTVDREGLAGLDADERVETVAGAPQLSLIRPVRVAAAKLSTNLTWGIAFLKVPKLWDQGLTGKGVRVGHLDTGADGKHPALKKAIASFAEFDSSGFQVEPNPKPHDTDEHGTHTAATIAGRAVQGRSVGVAPKAELASAIVIEGGNTVARILGGLDWALTQNVRILSMSLGLRGLVNSFLAITKALRARNILPVFAVGNEGPGTSRSPGNYSEALSVGANDRNGSVPDFSSSQRFARAQDPLVPDLVGPGVDVISAKPGGGFQLMSGTSMATPHVAGLAALLFEAKPDATANDVETAIFKSCTLGTISPDRGNRGFPDATLALSALTGTTLTSSMKRPTRPRGKASKKAAGKASKKSNKRSRKVHTKSRKK
jgi:subtilisin